MTRTYSKSRRAEKEGETRDRIVGAALALHTEIGPNRTTVSMIAERAGVQRHTVYAHLPDERAILLACSGLHAERAPLPSPDLWAALNDPETRLRAALTAVYAWFEGNQRVTAAVLRDAEQNAALAEVAEFRFGEPFGAIVMSLADGLGTKGNAALRLALSFYTWRSLVRDAGLSTPEAVNLMARSVLGADTA